LASPNSTINKWHWVRDLLPIHRCNFICRQDARNIDRSQTVSKIAPWADTAYHVQRVSLMYTITIVNAPFTKAKDYGGNIREVLGPFAYEALRSKSVRIWSPDSRISQHESMVKVRSVIRPFPHNTRPTLYCSSPWCFLVYNTPSRNPLVRWNEEGLCYMLAV
jgi:hypothetical protein